MRSKQSGMTVFELMVAMTILAFVMLSALGLYSFSTLTYHRTDTDITVNRENSVALRRISERLRNAMWIEILEDGKLLEFGMPELAPGTNSDTNEEEYTEPLEWDGVTHYYEVENGQLIDGDTGDVLVDNVTALDPHPDSTQYNQEYAPFAVTTIGSVRAVTINLITQDKVIDEDRYARMKTTAIVRNSQ